jgi:transcriptional regulator with XRE-family HTH domain
VAKSDEARGPIGVWLRRERLARGWKDTDVTRELAKRGIALLPASYRGYEAGPQPPSAQLLQGLEAVFGSKAPDTTKEAAEPVGLDGLIAAIYVQTAAITRLAEALETRLTPEEAAALRSVDAAEAEGTPPAPTGGGGSPVEVRQAPARD